MRSLQELLADRNIRLKTYGPGEHYTTCPNCSERRKPANKKKPCLGVKIDDEGGAVWNCNHCNNFSGNIPGRRGYDYQPERKPVSPGKQPPADLTPHEGMLEWFRNRRGIPAEIVEEMGIYYDSAFFPQTGTENPCIVFPFRLSGQVVNNKYRDKDKNFRQDKDALKVVYNIDSLQGNDTGIWVEGEMDVLAVKAAGYPSVVSLPDGAPKKHNPEIDHKDQRYLPIQNCADQLAPIKKWILAGDSDEAGKNLAYQLAHRLGLTICYRVRWPQDCKDANETLLKWGVDRVRQCIDSAEGYPIEGLRKVEIGELLAWRSAPAQQRFNTGIPELDEFLTFRPRQVCVVTGWPGDGKSQFVAWLSTVLNHRFGWRSVICSPEHEFEELSGTLVEQHVGKPLKAYSPYHFPMTDIELAEAEVWLRANYTMIAQEDENKLLDIDSLLKLARIARLREGANVLIIDPYNNFQHTRPKDMNETDYVLHLMLRLRMFAKANDMLVFLLAHPAKMRKDPKEKKRPIPMCGDIAGSQNFWNATNMAFTIYRPDMTNSDVNVIVEKVKRKDQGKSGIAAMKWDSHSGRYSARQTEDQPQGRVQGDLMSEYPD